MSEEITGWYLNKEFDYLYYFYEKGIFKQTYNSDFHLHDSYTEEYASTRQLKEKISVYQFWILNYGKLREEDLKGHPGIVFYYGSIPFDKNKHISLFSIYEDICKQVDQYRPFAGKSIVSNETFRNLVNDVFTLD